MSLYTIYKQLNITPDNGLCIVEGNNCEKNLPKRLSFVITEKLKPKSFFCFDGKPLILFYDSLPNKEDVLKKIWNFNESPIVIINEPNVVEIYNGFSYLKNEESQKPLTAGENLTDFSYFELITSRSLEKYKDEFRKEKRVDRILLNNIKAAREILIKQHGINPAIANALIGKCIFVRYLIDREVTLQYEVEINSNESFCNLLDNKKTLIKFFKYLENRFNGEAFLLNDDQLYAVPQEAFNTLKRLLDGEEISNGQLSLFDVYDFSIIPIEFISNVYENFMDEEKQKGSGAYYTPKFLVDYILSETVEKRLKDQSEYNCRVLDPACGSGIFLVEALRRIIEKYQELHNGIIAKEKLKQLAEDNIYGVDKDENAINVAIFSIYLALLDYQKPKEIENFIFPNLIQNGNLYIADFFDTNAQYNKNFKKLEFDFIIGNPPWKRGGMGNDLFMQYIQNRDGATISNKEIAQAFLLRTSDFSSENTHCALIVTSKVLYNLKAKHFRSYFLKNYFINKALELAPVAKEIFDSANAPAVILFFKYAHEENTESNLITHQCLKPSRLFTLFKIFTLQKPDIKTVVQKRLIEYDWLWKVLVYGSYLDFNFLKKLNNDYRTIEQTLKKHKLLKAQGVIVGKKDKKYDVPEYIGKSLINHKKDIQQYNVVPSLNWKEQKVTRKRKDILFKAPFLLVKHALDSNMNIVSAISYTDALYKHSITGIKGDEQTLKTLCGLLNSDFFRYFIVNNSIASIDRGRAHDSEKFNFPYIKNTKIIKTVGQIEKITKRINEKILVNPRLKKQKNNLVKALDNEIFESFGLSEQERDLVDYATDITIPRIKNHHGYEDIFSPITFENELLNSYIQIYFSRFAGSFGDDEHLKAEIWHTQHILGIFFKVVSKSNQRIEWRNQSNDDFLEKISTLGIENPTKNLFIQKDIRCFEEDGFYIIKPNEKNLWHKAMAHLDADDFMNAILKTGRENYNE